MAHLPGEHPSTLAHNPTRTANSFRHFKTENTPCTSAAGPAQSACTAPVSVNSHLGTVNPAPQGLDAHPGARRHRLRVSEEPLGGTASL